MQRLGVTPPVAESSGYAAGTAIDGQTTRRHGGSTDQSMTAAESTKVRCGNARCGGRRRFRLGSPRPVRAVLGLHGIPSQPHSLGNRLRPFEALA